MTNNESINNVLAAVNETGEKYIFVCNDLVHALGFIGLFKEFHIISYDRSALADKMRVDGITVHLLEEEYGDIDDLLKTTNNLVSHDFTKKVISGISGRKNLLVFKNSLIVKERARKLGVALLSAEPKISRWIENKVSFYEYLHGKDIPLIPGEIVENMADADYSVIAEKYGAEFVLQASKGFGGNKTFLIKNAGEFETIKNAYIKRPMRLTRLLHGMTITINACATALGTLAKAPFHQLTGHAELTQNSMGACGNDFNISNIDNGIVDGIIKSSEKIGDILYENGFKGFFGIDFLVCDDRYYFIECNPRFVTSLPIFTHLELLRGEPPLTAFHLLELQGKIESVKDEFLRCKNSATSRANSGAQMIMHNLSDKTKSISGDMKSGIYMLSDDLTFVRDGGGFEDIATDDECLVIVKISGKPINSGMECARIMSRGGALEGGELSGKMKKIISIIYSRLFIENLSVFK